MSTNKKLKHSKLGMESLEGREMMTGLALAPSVASAITAALVSDDRYENNDTQAAASQLGTITGQQTFSNLSMNDTANWYRFRIEGTASSNGSVQLNFQHSQGDIDVRLYNATGQQIGASSGVGNSERISLSGLGAGEYFVKVFGYNGAHNPNYSMTINPSLVDDRFDNNDTMGTASNLGNLTSAQTYSDLRMVDNADFYRFHLDNTASGEGYVQLNFLHSQGDVDVRLYNAAGQQVGASSGVGNSERISLAGLGAGDYTIKVFGYNGAYNPHYSMTIDPGQDDRFENNDTRATAANLGNLSSQQTYSNLRMLDSADWYRFHIDTPAMAEGYVQLNFLHSQGDVDVQLYNSAGTLVSSSTGVGNTERISLSGLAAGDYFVKVYGYNGAHNTNYSMTINPAQDDRFENNDSMATATQLGTLSAQQTYSNLRMADTSDWFRFRLDGTASSQAFVQLNFLHSQGDIDLRLYNAAGNQVSISQSVTDNERISLAGLGAGEYFIRAYGYNGAHNLNYSMTINPGQTSLFDQIRDSIFGNLGAQIGPFAI